MKFKKASQLIIVFLALGLLVSGVSCTTQQKQEDKGNPSGLSDRRRTFTMETNFRDKNLKGKSFSINREKKFEDLRFDKTFEWIEKMLILEGLVPKSKNADYEITLQLDVKKPVTGISIGILAPFKHTMTLRARKNGNLTWQIVATGPSEYEELGQFPALLLGASRHYFGKTTAGAEDFAMNDNDSKVEELIKDK